MIEPGLCARCVHGRVVPGARSQFWMCDAAKDDPTLRRYPPLPVLVCHAFSEAGAGGGGPAGTNPGER